MCLCDLGEESSFGTTGLVSARGKVLPVQALKVPTKNASQKKKVWLANKNSSEERQMPKYLPSRAQPLPSWVVQNRVYEMVRECVYERDREKENGIENGIENGRENERENE